MGDLTTYAAADPVAAMILAHGAGAGQKSAWIVKAAEALAERGVSCATFDFPYITAGKKVPDRTPVLEAHWRKMLDQGCATFGRIPLFIGGKSMGGRIASHIAAQGVPDAHSTSSGQAHSTGSGQVSGVVFFGYPLHPPGRPDQRRDAHLYQIAEPMLFVQGSRDTFGNDDEIAAMLPSLPRATLHVVPGGNHSFKVPGGAKAQQPAFDDAMDAAAAWMKAVLGASG